MILQQHELLCGLGAMTTNGYVVANETTHEMLVADPAGEAEKLQKIAEELAVKPVALLLTHAHMDHLMALGTLQKAWQVPVYAGKGDEALFDSFMQQLQDMVPGFVPGKVDHWVGDGDILQLAGFSIEVIATPGHSKGSVCYYIAEEGVLLSGDTLFRESIGRTDFPGEMRGDHRQLLASIQQKLLARLPDETRVYTGHGPATTLSHEKRYNPFL